MFTVSCMTVSGGFEFFSGVCTAHLMLTKKLKPEQQAISDVFSGSATMLNISV